MIDMGRKGDTYVRGARGIILVKIVRETWLSVTSVIRRDIENINATSRRDQLMLKMGAE